MRTLGICIGAATFTAVNCDSSKDGVVMDVVQRESTKGDPFKGFIRFFEEHDPPAHRSEP